MAMEVCFHATELLLQDRKPQNPRNMKSTWNIKSTKSTWNMKSTYEKQLHLFGNQLMAFNGHQKIHCQIVRVWNLRSSFGSLRNFWWQPLMEEAGDFGRVLPWRICLRCFEMGKSVDVYWQYDWCLCWYLLMFIDVWWHLLMFVDIYWHLLMFVDSCYRRLLRGGEWNGQGPVCHGCSLSHVRMECKGMQGNSIRPDSNGTNIADLGTFSYSWHQLVVSWCFFSSSDILGIFHLQSTYP